MWDGAEILFQHCTLVVWFLDMTYGIPSFCTGNEDKISCNQAESGQVNNSAAVTCFCSAFILSFKVCYSIYPSGNFTYFLLDWGNSPQRACHARGPLRCFWHCRMKAGWVPECVGISHYSPSPSHFPQWAYKVIRTSLQQIQTIIAFIPHGLWEIMHRLIFNLKLQCCDNMLHQHATSSTL